MNDNDVVIVHAYRTPIGTMNSCLSTVKAHDLGSLLIKTIMEKCNNSELQPDLAYIGQTLTAGQGQNPARQAVIKSGLSNKVNATSINMLCGSGLLACALGYQAIKCGDAKICICGGQESVSQAPHCMHLRKKEKSPDAKMLDTLQYDGLTDVIENVLMGHTAEYVAQKYEISREMQDEFAFNSQSKYAKALESGAFVDEIIPVTVKLPDDTEKIVSVDEFPKPNTTIEGLSLLKPVFKKEADGGSITPGNASGVNDAAAMLLLMSLNEAKKYNQKPLVRIVSWAQSACESMLMGVCPVEAINECLNKAKWTLDDVDLFELNEAFASQSVAINKILKVDESKVNINGGSIALGHPIGCSGARILVTLIHSLIRKNLKRGLAAICIGGGQSIAMCIERVE